LTTTRSITSASEETANGAAAAPARRNPGWKLKFAWFARWLHTYLSMFAFLILFFFAATGFTLNHAAWFDSQQKTVQRQGTLDSVWVAGDANAVKKFEIEQYFVRTQGVKGQPGDFEVNATECDVSFKGPGYEADVTIDRSTGKYQLTETRSGFVAVLNDLHKGRDTGEKWSVVIDVAAIGMTLVSLTGLTLIFFLTKRRAFGLMAIAIGAAICYLAYALWVP
jgi:hypothetical protein